MSRQTSFKNLEKPWRENTNFLNQKKFDLNKKSDLNKKI